MVNYHPEIDQVDDGGGQTTAYSERKESNMSITLDVEEYERQLRERRDTAMENATDCQDKGYYNSANQHRAKALAYDTSLEILKDMVDIDGWKRAHTQKVAKEGGTNGG